MDINYYSIKDRNKKKVIWLRCVEKPKKCVIRNSNPGLNFSIVKWKS